MGVTNYIWDEVGDNVLMETDENDDTIATYTHEPGLHGELISMHRDGQSYYYDYDGEGNTVAVTDEDQNVVEEASYTAFGEVVEKTSSIVNPFGYRGALGYYTNPETNDIYARARTYEPTVARWLSKDPMGFIDGSNLYQYAANSPIMFSDPSGNFSVPCFRRWIRNCSILQFGDFELSRCITECYVVAEIMALQGVPFDKDVCRDNCFFINLLCRPRPQDIGTYWAFQLCIAPALIACR